MVRYSFLHGVGEKLSNGQPIDAYKASELLGRIRNTTPERVQWAKFSQVEWSHVDLTDEEAAGIVATPIKTAVPETREVMCDCGHLCKENLVMSASLGTACSVECYDRLSN